MTEALVFLEDIMMVSLLAMVAVLLVFIAMAWVDR